MRMYFHKLVVICLLSITFTNEIEDVSGMPSGKDDQTNSAVPSIHPTQQRSYSTAVITGPSKIDEDSPSSHISKAAKRNKQRRDRKKEQKTSTKAASVNVSSSESEKQSFHERSQYHESSQEVLPISNLEVTQDQPSISASTSELKEDKTLLTSDASIGKITTKKEKLKSEMAPSETSSKTQLQEEFHAFNSEKGEEKSLLSLAESTLKVQKQLLSPKTVNDELVGNESPVKDSSQEFISYLKDVGVLSSRAYDHKLEEETSLLNKVSPLKSFPRSEDQPPTETVHPIITITEIGEKKSRRWGSIADEEEDEMRASDLKNFPNEGTSNMASINNSILGIEEKSVEKISSPRIMSGDQIETKAVLPSTNVSIQEKTLTKSSKMHKEGESTSQPEEMLKNSYANKNALLIISKTPGTYANIELEQSNINPKAYKTTNIVRLINSGMIVKCASKEGLNSLKEAILENFEGLSVETKVFSSHLVCVYDVPQGSTDADISFTFLRKYGTQPLSVQFVPYEANWKQTLKIALIDITDLLLDQVKNSPFIQVQWKPRKIHICLPAYQEEQPQSVIEPDETSNIKTTSSSESQISIQNIDVVIDDLPGYITAADIDQIMFQKYKETPIQVQLVPFEERKTRQVAKLLVNEMLLEKILASPKLQLGWNERTIQTSLGVFRCTNCHLLGHVAKFCPEKSRSSPLPHEPCLDCCNYNQENIEGHQRDPDHETDSDVCPTKIMYLLSHLKQKKSDSITAQEESGRSNILERESTLQSSSLKSSQKHNPITSTPLANEPVIEESPDEESSSIDISHSDLSDTSMSERFLEAVVGQSVEQTLAKVFPLFNKSVEQTLSQMQPEGPSTTPINEFVRQNRGKEKIFEENNAEKDISSNRRAFRQHKDNRNSVVLVKSKDPKIDVTKELGKMEIDSRYFQIDRAVFYPSGDVLLACNSVKGAEYLKYIAAQSPNLEILAWKSFPIKVRIDNVPEEVTGPQIGVCIYQKYSETPEKVQFRPYRNPWNKNVKLAFVNITESLLKKIEASPVIILEGRPLKIDSLTKPIRCQKCQLFGHRAEVCRAVSRPPPLRYEKCLDCCNYNRRLRNTKLSFQPRDENHLTNDDNCPSKLAFITNLNN